MAKNNNLKTSDYLGISEPYTAFCLDEAAQYIYNHIGEKTEREKIIEQNKGLMHKGKKKDK